jgi:hypothetical protein
MCLHRGRLARLCSSQQRRQPRLQQGDSVQCSLLGTCWVNIVLIGACMHVRWTCVRCIFPQHRIGAARSQAGQGRTSIQQGISASLHMLVLEWLQDFSESHSGVVYSCCCIDHASVQHSVNLGLKYCWDCVHCIIVFTKLAKSLLPVGCFFSLLLVQSCLLLDCCFFTPAYCWLAACVVSPDSRRFSSKSCCIAT